MAIVGSAHVVLRAVTDKLAGDIQKGLKDAIPAANAAGNDAGKAFTDGMNRHLEGSNVGQKAFSGVEGEASKAGNKAGTAAGKGVREGLRKGANEGGRELANAGGGIGDRVGRAFKNGFNGSGASRTFVSMGLRIAALVPILGALVGAISTVVSGLFAMGAAASQALGAFAVLPGLLTALAQGAAVLMTSFGGVGKALTAGLAVSAKTTKATTDGLKDNVTSAHRAVRDATRGLADAQSSAADNIKNAMQGVRDSRQNLRDTYVNASRAEADAARQVQSAEENLARAHKAVQQAQEDLTQARVDAKERLLDLQFAVEGGALAERRAQMTLADARYELNAASTLPVDNRLRMEAQLAYEEADLSLRQIRERNGDLAEEQGKIKKTGINGMREVVDAQDRLKDAQDGVRDSVRAVNDALRNQRQTHVDNARAIAGANRQVAESEKALADARRDAPIQIRAAREALGDAKKQLIEANAALRAGGPAATAYSTAMAGLSKPARDFVKYLISIRGELKALKVASQEELFPRLQTAIQTLVDGLFPSLERMMRKTGAAVGDAAKSISKDMTSGPFVASFRNVTDQNATTIRRLGLVIGDLARYFFALMDAARPLTNEFTKWAVGWADNLRATTEAKNRTGDLTKTLGVAGESFKQIVRIVKNIAEGFWDLGDAATPAGQKLLDAFEKSTKAFADFTDKPKNRRMLHEFFEDVRVNMMAISSLLLVVGGSFARLGADPAIGKVAEALEPVVRKLEKLITTMLKETGTGLVDALSSLSDVLNELSQTGGLNAFLGTLTGFMDILSALLRGPLGPAIGLFIKFSAVMFALKLINKFPGVNMLTKGLGGLGRAFFVNTRFGRSLVGALRLQAFALKTLAVEAVKATAKFIWQKTVMVGQAIASRAIAAGTWAMTIAQRAFNIAMRMNPIGLIITGIVALGAALVWAYKHFEGFRKVVDAVFGFVVDKAKWLWDVLFGHSIFPDMLKAFRSIFGLIGKVIKIWWTVMVKPYFTLLMFIVNRAVIPVIKLLGRVIGVIFKAIGTVIRVWWNVVAKPIFNAVKWYLNNILVPIFRFLYNKVIKPVFDSVGRKISGVWKNVIRPAFRALGSFIGDVIVPAFRKGISAIGDIWDNLKGLAAKPVNFMIDTVYNKGIRGMVNKVLGFFGSKKELPKISTIGTGKAAQKAASNPGGANAQAKNALATGGVLPGYTPGRDPHRFYSSTAGELHLSGGEAVMRPEWTAAVGPQRVHEWNKAARRGGRAGVKKIIEGGQHFLGGITKFAKGGVMSPSARVTMDGKSISNIAARQIMLAEKISRINFHLMQGGFGGSHIAASGSSHNYPGVADIGPASIGIEKLFRRVGFAAWARNIAGRRSVGSGAHIHAVSLLDPSSRSSPQVYGSWARGGDGLGGSDQAPHYSWIPGLTKLLGASNLKGISGGGIGGAVASLWDGIKSKVSGGMSALKSGASKLISQIPGVKSGWGQAVAAIPKNIVARAKNMIGEMVKGAKSKFIGGGGGSSIPGMNNNKSVTAAVKAGQKMAASRGWTGNQWTSLKNLWNRESGWRYWADNPSSSAYGIPQALPGSKMASAGADWKTNPSTQIKWGLGYIKGRYGNPAAAWAHSNAHNWYDAGGIARGGETWIPKKTALPERVLDPRQTQAFERLVDILDRKGTDGAGDQVNHLTLQMPQDASGRDVVDTLIYELGRMQRGGRYS